MCQESQWAVRNAEGRVIEVDKQTGPPAEISIRLPPKMNIAVCTC